MRGGYNRAIGRLRGGTLQRGPGRGEGGRWDGKDVMMRLGLAIKAFFRALMDKTFARRLEALMAGEGQDAAAAVAEKEPPPEAPPAPERAAPEAKRSEALTLLALLQREARLVDFVQEPLDDYPDAQVGAAVRDIHRNLRSTVERVFDLRPVTEQDEGQDIEVEPGYSPMRFTLAGNVSGQPPYTGVVRHRGWMVTRCELPAWTGRDEDARIIAPAEVEVR